MDVRSAYDVNPLYTAGADGRGQTIAGAVDRRLLTDGYERFGAGHGPSLDGAEDRAAADAASCRAAARPTSTPRSSIRSRPEAHIVDYQIAFQDLPDVVNQIVAQHSATVISGQFRRLRHEQRRPGGRWRSTRDAQRH